MGTFYPKHAVFIKQIIDRSRRGEESMLTDSSKATNEIIEYLSKEWLLAREGKIPEAKVEFY